LSGDWHREIERTDNAVQLMRLARDYVATLTPRDLARIPSHCRPGRMLDEDALCALSRRLAETYWQVRGSQTDAIVLHDLWSFFLRASVHLARFRQQERL